MRSEEGSPVVNDKTGFKKTDDIIDKNTHPKKKRMHLQE